METWDRETDVVVAGYGLAGAISAIVAHDAGARTLILEKGEYPGGLSILAGGAVRCVSDVEAAIAYLTELSGERVDSSLIRPFAEGLAENEEFLRRLAQIDGAQVTAVRGVAGMYEGVYPFPGREAFYSVRVAKIPDFNGFPWVQQLRPQGVNLMKMVMDNVEARGVESWFSAPARRLETDSQGRVSGVVVEREGKEIAIRARRAVILACGGFEQNEWLQKQYLQGKPFYSMAPLTHTGDGVLMAQKVGAALWHMWHIHGSYGFKFPEFPIAFRHTFSGFRNPKRVMPWVVVDKFGARYMNEYQPAPQDTMHRAMELFDPDLPGYPRIPSYLIFDEVGRKREPIGFPLALGQYVYEWSKDNSEEIKRGWILGASTLRELAQKIREVPENEAMMDPEVLEATIAQWNGYVASGKDPLHRPPGTMMRLENPPFYAAQVWPIISNTQGGPVHNVRQQVVDPFGQPIPQLYAAGELGSFFGHLYELSGNLGECVSSGRIAGENAAAEEPLP